MSPGAGCRGHSRGEEFGNGGGGELQVTLKSTWSVGPSDLRFPTSKFPTPKQIYQKTQLTKAVPGTGRLMEG